MRKRIIFHGYLHDLIPDPVEVIAATVAQAIETISRFVPALRPNGIRGRHRISIVGCHNEADLHTVWKSDEIHIFPQVCGGAKNGLVQIIVGALLIAASFATGLPLWASSALFAMGASMVLGGLIALLSPAPKNDSGKQRYLGPPKNTTAIGTKIPILFGKFRTYGQILSFSIVARLRDKEDENT